MKVLFIRAPILFIKFSYGKTFFEKFPTVWLWDIFPFPPIIYLYCNMFHLSFNVAFSLYYFKGVAIHQNQSKKCLHVCESNNWEVYIIFGRVYDSRTLVFLKFTVNVHAYFSDESLK